LQNFHTSHFLILRNVTRMGPALSGLRRPASSEKKDQVDAGVSEPALVFVQQCQVAVLACARDDYVAQVVSIWTCLSQFPRRSADADRLTAIIAVSRVARGFFSARATAECLPATLRRRHANAVLQVARTRFAQSDLTLGSVASELRMSVGFLSRALSAETGHALKSAFRSHLNGIRVLAAIEQMRRSDSFGAIANAVGYPRTGELDRQFERWFAVSPRVFRGFLRGDPTVRAGD
jgi:AraC-like DNA-binding protein